MDSSITILYFSAKRCKWEERCLISRRFSIIIEHQMILSRSIPDTSSFGASSSACLDLPQRRVAYSRILVQDAPETEVAVRLYARTPLFASDTSRTIGDYLGEQRPRSVAPITVISVFHRIQPKVERYSLSFPFATVIVGRCRFA